MFQVAFYTGFDVPVRIAKGAPGKVQMERVPEWGEVVEVRGGPNGGSFLYVDEVITVLAYNDTAKDVLGFPTTYEVRLVESDPRERPVNLTVS